MTETPSNDSGNDDIVPVDENLKKIIEIVNGAYPDNMIKRYFDDPDVNHGDSLAEFITREIVENYDDNLTYEVQITEAIRLVRNAMNEVIDVFNALDNALIEHTKHLA